MTDQEILDAIRASGVTKEQLVAMLTKNMILVTVEEKRAELARAVMARDEALKVVDNQHAVTVNALRDALAELEARAAAQL